MSLSEELNDILKGWKSGSWNDDIHDRLMALQLRLEISESSGRVRELTELQMEVFNDC